MIDTTATASTDHVLIIGIDGVRYDTLRRVPTPALDAIGARGFLAPTQVNPAGPTISGPSWATIFTGVLADRHQIFDNDFTGHRLSQFPDILTLARSARPEVATWVGAAWPPLVSAVSGGPMFTGGGLLPCADQESQDQLDHGQPVHAELDWDVLDEQVTQAAEQFIGTHDGSHGSLVVCYLGAPDEIAHAQGVVPSYEHSITDSDSRAGRLLEAAASRPGEDWVVIAVTDHGHVDAGGHGGETVEERTAWVAACGPGIGTAPADLEQADVAAQAVASLGIDGRSWSYMTGKPFRR